MVTRHNVAERALALSLPRAPGVGAGVGRGVVGAGVGAGVVGAGVVVGARVGAQVPWMTPHDADAHWVPSNTS